jgi:hypothetical protein
MELITLIVALRPNHRQCGNHRITSGLQTIRPERQRKMIIVASRGPGIATNSMVRA